MMEARYREGDAAVVPKADSEVAKRQRISENKATGAGNYLVSKKVPDMKFKVTRRVVTG